MILLCLGACACRDGSARYVDHYQTFQTSTDWWSCPGCKMTRRFGETTLGDGYYHGGWTSPGALEAAVAHRNRIYGFTSETTREITRETTHSFHALGVRLRLNGRYITPPKITSASVFKDPIPTVRWRAMRPLRDEDCWRQHDAAVEAQTRFATVRQVETTRTIVCTVCGNTTPWFNGRDYWCCGSTPVIPVETRVERRVQKVVTFVSPSSVPAVLHLPTGPDPYLEEIRYLYPTLVSRWPFGRIRPTVVTRQEGLRRTRVRRRVLRLDGLATLARE
jgi:hypothetical protein